MNKAAKLTIFSDKSANPRQKMPQLLAMAYCGRLFTHVTIASKASGEMVSSIAPYSLTEPVVQCCSKWFNPSIDTILLFTLEGRPLLRAPKLSS